MIDESETAASPQRQAAVSLIIGPEGKMLCVWNRRYGGWSLPGGMVEDGETPEQAQRRELEEETGLGTESAARVFTGEHNIKSVEGAARPGRASVVNLFKVRPTGEPRQVEEGCPVTWLTREEFLSHSPFSEFYKRVFEILAAYWGVVGWKCDALCGWRDQSAHTERHVGDVCPDCRTGKIALLYKGEIQ